MGTEFQLQKIADLAAQADGAARSGASAPPEGEGFADVLGRLVGEVDSLQQESTDKLTGFAEGRTDDVHDVMLAMTRADLSFRMMLEVRNKLVEAYQEVMRTQV
jgi:flagellar hook-basal body complex protein FliE